MEDGSKDKSRDESEFLTRNGGWVLLLLGVGLIALGVVTVDHEVVASAFAFTGIASAILGVLLPRLEGDFEFSPTRLAATLQAVRSASVREDLTFDERANEILRLLGVGGARSSETRQQTEEAGSGLSQRGERDVDLAEVTAFVVRNTGGGHLALAFEHHVMEAFRRSGWAVESVGPGSDLGVDFVAQREGQEAFVQVKLARRFTVADLDYLISSFYRADRLGTARHVLAINSGALSATARGRLRVTEGLDVVEIPVEGW